MTTMRRFFKCKIGIIFLLCSTSVFGQDESLNVYDDWFAFAGSQKVSLYNYIREQAFKEIDEREGNVSKLTTKADWLTYQQSIKQKLRIAFGPFPQKTPLNVVITGKLKRPTFHVEKFYLESRPGYYVTGALFVPNRKGKMPAVIFCSGHIPNSFRENYQKLILNLAEKGFVVLAFDPIGQGERLQYENMKPTHEHSRAGSGSFLLGIPPANYFIWDGMRMVDYLLTRKEVDGNRIGITGQSGGGTQSCFIAAMDDRIKAAAPEDYLTNYRMLLMSRGPQDTEQIPCHFLSLGLDMADLLIARAPKPTLMITTTRDMFSIQGAMDTFNEASKGFKALGDGASNLFRCEDDTTHAQTKKNREACYAFFQKYLDNPGSSEDQDVKLFSSEELHVVPTGQVVSSLHSETMFSMVKKQSEETRLEREKLQQDFDSYESHLKQWVIDLSGYKDPGTHATYIYSGRTHKGTYSVYKYLVKGLGDYYLPVVRLVPKESKEKKAVLYLDDRGKDYSTGDGEVAMQWLRKGYEVVAADLSGIGELATGYMTTTGDSYIDGQPLNLWHAGILTDRSIVGIRAGEIHLLCAFIKEINHDVPIIGMSKGALGSELLHAAVIKNMFDSVVLDDALGSYQSIIDHPMYHAKYVMSAEAGALRNFDLPDLVAFLSRQGLKVSLVNPVDAEDKPISDYFEKFEKSHINQEKCEIVR